MVNENTIEKRKRPKFLRRDWHKKIKFGKTVKKNRKWRAAKGRQNKVRLGQRGYRARPKIGYSEVGQIRGLVAGFKPIYVENLTQVSILKEGDAIIIAHVGAKKKILILEEAKKKKLVILNKYKENKK